jgi:hypothetical protein
MPTEPQVKQLLEVFGLPKPGIIKHEEIERVINEKFRTRRYETVVKIWRKRLYREHNIDTTAERGVGVKVLTEPERIDASSKDFGSAVKKTARSHVRALKVVDEKLSEKDKYKADHLRRVTASVVGSATSSIREYRRLVTRMSDPSQQLPHRTDR